MYEGGRSRSKKQLKYIGGFIVVIIKYCVKIFAESRAFIYQDLESTPVIVTLISFDICVRALEHHSAWNLSAYEVEG